MLSNYLFIFECVKFILGILQAHSPDPNNLNKQ